MRKVTILGSILMLISAAGLGLFAAQSAEAAETESLAKAETPQLPPLQEVMHIHWRSENHEAYDRAQWGTAQTVTYGTVDGYWIGNPSSGFQSFRTPGLGFMGSTSPDFGFGSTTYVSAEPPGIYYQWFAGFLHEEKLEWGGGEGRFTEESTGYTYIYSEMAPIPVRIEYGARIILEVLGFRGEGAEIHPELPARREWPPMPTELPVYAFDMTAEEHIWPASEAFEFATLTQPTLALWLESSEQVQPYYAHFTNFDVNKNEEFSWTWYLHNAAGELRSVNVLGANTPAGVLPVAALFDEQTDAEPLTPETPLLPSFGRTKAQFEFITGQDYPEDVSILFDHSCTRIEVCDNRVTQFQFIEYWHGLAALMPKWEVNVYHFADPEHEWRGASVSGNGWQPIVPPLGVALPIPLFNEPAKNEPPEEQVAAAFIETAASPFWIALTASTGAGLLLWPLLKFLGIALLAKGGEECREAILALIQAEPGIHVQALMDRTGLANGVLRFHLHKLERMGMITATMKDRKHTFRAL